MPVVTAHSQRFFARIFFTSTVQCRILIVNNVASLLYGPSRFQFSYDLYLFLEVSTHGAFYSFKTDFTFCKSRRGQNFKVSMYQHEYSHRAC